MAIRPTCRDSRAGLPPSVAKRRLGLNALGHQVQASRPKLDHRRGLGADCPDARSNPRNCATDERNARRDGGCGLPGDRVHRADRNCRILWPAFFIDGHAIWSAMLALPRGGTVQEHRHRGATRTAARLRILYSPLFRKDARFSNHVERKILLPPSPHHKVDRAATRPAVMAGQTPRRVMALHDDCLVDYHSSNGFGPFIALRFRRCAHLRVALSDLPRAGLRGNLLILTRESKARLPDRTSGRVVLIT